MNPSTTMNSGTTQHNAQDLLPLLDLTSLQGDESLQTIKTLCQTAVSPLGKVAAVCVYPKWVQQARVFLDTHNATDIAVACVINFPHGMDAEAEITTSVQAALDAGAREIDFVFDYTAYLAGQEQQAFDKVALCKKLCQKRAKLKVILETGAYPDTARLKQACLGVIAAGADCLKTSTGKFHTHATLETARVLLESIQESGLPIAFKVAGGVRSLETAWAYVRLAQQVMGPDFICPNLFRIGASVLWHAIAEAMQTQVQLHDVGENLRAP